MGKSGAAAAPGDLSLDAAAFASLCDTVIKVSDRITELFGDLIGVIVMTSVGVDVETSTVAIPDGPKISTFTLPYFFNENDALPASSALRSAFLCGSVVPRPRERGTVRSSRAAGWGTTLPPHDRVKAGATPHLLSANFVSWLS
jgi:hypothetical protein